VIGDFKMAKLGSCVIFGCGSYGKQTLKKLRPHYDVVAFCDNNASLYGLVIEDTPVVSLEELLKHEKNGAIVVVSNRTKYRQIAVQLIRLGVNKVYIMNEGFSYFYGDGEMFPFSLLPENVYFKKKSAEKLSVLYVQYYPNIRLSRIAKVIKELNCEVVIAYYAGTHQKGTIDVFENNCYCFSTYDELFSWVNFSEFDIVHVANRRLVTLLLHTNKKIILDVHDVYSFFENLSPEELLIEFIENSLCDGAIYTNKTIQDIVLQKYGMDSSKTHIVENFPLKNCAVSKRYRKLSESDNMLHIVYQGDMAVLDSNERNFTSYWLKLAKAGVHIHIYSSHIGYQEIEQIIKENQFIHYEGNLSSDELASEMTKYNCGWMMFNTEEGISKVHLDYCSTNKLYEYLNSGLPVIIGDSKCHKEFVEKYHCGSTLNFNEDIIAQLNKISLMKIADDFIVKNKFTMEDQANGILNFYKSIIENDVEKDSE